MMGNLKRIEKDRRYRAANRDRLLAEHRARYQAKQQAALVSELRLKELLTYIPETGCFHYKSPRGRFKAGDKAGTKGPDGRVSIVVDGRRYLAHRLAWLYMTGKWPSNEIDHIDTCPWNNSWANLRDVTPTVNKQNLRSAPKSKKYSPLLGAQWCKKIGRWKSRIKVNGAVVYLGVFDSPEDASLAYLNAKRVLHEGCTL